MSSKATTPVNPSHTGKQAKEHYSCTPREDSKFKLEHAEKHGIGSGVYYRNHEVRGKAAGK